MKVNGYCLKNLKTINTPDGGGFNANIYFENKKICEVFDAGMGGSIDLNWFFPKIDIETSKKLRTIHEDVLTASFIFVLCHVYEAERVFKAFTKKNPNGIIVDINTNNFTGYICKIPNGKSMPDEAVLKLIYKTVPEISIECVRTYKTIDDFVFVYPHIPSLIDSLVRFFKLVCTLNKTLKIDNDLLNKTKIEDKINDIVSCANLKAIIEELGLKAKKSTVTYFEMKLYELLEEQEKNLLGR